MANFTYAELRELARKAGFNAGESQRMAVIALLESSGNPNAKNPNSSATGLWQIMWSVHDDELRKQGIARTQQDLFNATVNARAAMMVYRKQGYNAWVVAGTPKFYELLKKYGDDSGSADSENNRRDSLPGKIGGIGGGINEAIGKAAASVNPIAGLTERLSAIAATSGVLILALVLLALGVVILLRNQIPAKKLLKAVAK